MKPVDFPQSTDVLAKDQPEYLPLPVHYDRATGVMTSCWEMTWFERLRCLVSGRVFVSQMTFGRALQPQVLKLDPPEDERDIRDRDAVQV